MFVAPFPKYPTPQPMKIWSTMLYNEFTNIDIIHGIENFLINFPIFSFPSIFSSTSTFSLLSAYFIPLFTLFFTYGKLVSAERKKATLSINSVVRYHSLLPKNVRFHYTSNVDYTNYFKLCQTSDCFFVVLLNIFYLLWLF